MSSMSHPASARAWASAATIPVRLRPAEVMHGIERGANGAAVEQHVVDEHDRFALDVERHLGWLHADDAALADVVAVHADVEHAGRRIVPPDAGEQPGQAPGQVDAAALNADQPDALAVGVGLGDLVRDARQSALDRVGIEE